MNILASSHFLTSTLGPGLAVLFSGNVPVVGNKGFSFQIMQSKDLGMTVIEFLDKL
jgi:hypothetical protein